MAPIGWAKSLTWPATSWMSCSRPGQPLRFELTAIAVIKRGPDSPFQVMRWAPLAAK